MKVYIKNRTTGKLFAGWVEHLGAEVPRWFDYPLDGWDYRIPTWSHIQQDIFNVVRDIKAHQEVSLLIVQEQYV